ncbi:MAG: methyltransferase domain-containing protein [Gloeobacteraceae cyanobacterium ES-bin-316]|nr:methyltransferase domain-containing protein [Ferruginibacter sp.]
MKKEKSELIKNDFKKIIDKSKKVDDVQTYVKNGITNTMVIDGNIEINNSMLTGPGISVLEAVARGSLQFNMNWTDFFKFMKIFTEIQDSGLPCPNVLDIGGRWGEVNQIVYRNRFKINYTCVELNISIVKKVCSELFTTTDSRYVVMDANKFIDIESVDNPGGYDFIILNDIVEHMDTKEKGMELILKSIKCLSSNGTMIITTPNSYEPGRMQYPEDHVYEFSLDELKGIFNKGRLKISEIYGTNILMRHLKNVPEDKKHLLGTGMLSEILGCKNAFIGLALPEYARHLYISLKKK